MNATVPHGPIARPAAPAHPNASAVVGITALLTTAIVLRSVVGLPVITVVPIAAAVGLALTVALRWHGDRAGREYDRRTAYLGTISRTFYLIVNRPPTDAELDALARGRALPALTRTLTVVGRPATARRPVTAGALPGGVRLLSVVRPDDGGNGGAA